MGATHTPPHPRAKLGHPHPRMRTILVYVFIRSSSMRVTLVSSVSLVCVLSVVTSMRLIRAFARVRGVVVACYFVAVRALVCGVGPHTEHSPGRGRWR